ncbi:MAG TPA: DUF5723 family protein [Chitinophagales bacterium]|nr:DUF5723 family protein [Chitinophagales bacterium]
MRTILLYAMLLLAWPASAQEFTGLRTGNFSGSNGMLLNPSSLLSGNLPWDVNLVSAGAFAQNNYIYAPGQSAVGLLSAQDAETAFFTTDYVNAHSNMLVQGPSGFINTGYFSFGLFTTARSAGYVHSGNFPEGVNVLENIIEDVPVQVGTVDLGLLNWMEFGANVGMALTRNLHVGANIKYLGGFDAITAHNREAFTFTRTDRDVELTNLLLDYSYSVNAGGYPENGLYQSNLNGWGLGADLGFTWMQPVSRSRKEYAAYNWKVGVSVVDMGFIRFRDGAGSYHLAANDQVIVANQLMDSISTAEELTAAGDLVLYDQLGAAQVDDKFPVFTPMAVSVQGSVNLGRGFFLQSLIVQNTAPVHEQMIARPNMVALIPQFDTRLVTVSVPVSVYDYEEVHVGTSLRVGWFTVGTDNLPSLLIPGDLDGADIYAGIRVMPWKHAGAAAAIGGASGRKARSRMLDCPDVF